MTVDVDQELFVITAAEISIALGEAPVAVAMADAVAYWYDDHCVVLCRPFVPAGRPDVPLGIAVALDGEIGGNAHARIALAELAGVTEVGLTVLGGDQSLDPITRLKGAKS
jgi:hypothetical protein